MRYDAVIFDLFGTLVHTVSPDAYAGMLDELSMILGVPAGAFTTQWRATVDERESGLLGSIEEILAATASAVGRQPSAAQVTSASDRWQTSCEDWLVPRDDTIATVQAFRDAGSKLGLLSNCSAEVPPLWVSSPLAPMFDATVFSCAVGAMKPHHLVYDTACELLGVRPNRCLFVGDGGSRELTGATAVGMEAILLRAPGEGHTWFDAHYRQDALEWSGTIVTSLSALIKRGV
jgi:putative hydrolase of the HAD superfamily